MKKLPDNARLMFEGVRYNIWQWEQTLFDGSTAVFEAAARADSVTLICTVGDKILVLEEQQPGLEPFLALPGGHSEGLDSPERTAKRKLMQESGYAISDIKSWFTAPYGWVLGDNYYFICRNVAKETEPSPDPGDKVVPQLITYDQFIDFRKNGMIRNRELLPILERAANNLEEYNKLHDLIFGNPEELRMAQEAARAQQEVDALKKEEEAEKALLALKAEAEKELLAKQAAIRAMEEKVEEAKRQAEMLHPHTSPAVPVAPLGVASQALAPAFVTQPISPAPAYVVPSAVLPSVPLTQPEAPVPPVSGAYQYVTPSSVPIETLAAPLGSPSAAAPLYADLLAEAAKSQSATPFTFTPGPADDSSGSGNGTQI
jgi:ADP-ribose pyrophosphatase YjhB (NUDIX family)